MGHKFTTPQTIAAALRGLAERLDALPAIDLPGTNVLVDVDIFDRSSSVEERVQAIDLLSYALAGSTGDVRSDIEQSIHYGIFPTQNVSPEGVAVGSITIVGPPDREAFIALYGSASTKSTPNTNP